MKKYKVNDYQQYKRNQVQRAGRKWGSTTFNDGIDTFDKEVESLVEEPTVIGCMGIRSGNEYTAFKERFSSAKVYGVDIHPDVKKVGKNCFAYDFNHLPKEWAGKFDLLYSNSIDHAFDVGRTISEWVRVTKQGGYLCLRFAKTAAGVSRTDIYGFEEGDIKDLFSEIETIKTWDNGQWTFSCLFMKS